MPFLPQRLYALIIKELLTLFKDPKTRIIIIAPPLLQLLVFSLAATLDVNSASIAVFNEDNGKHGLEIVNRIAGAPTFDQVIFVDDIRKFKPIIDEQQAIAAIHMPQDFSRQLEAEKEATIQIILDGRRSNAAQIVNGYLTQIMADYSQELRAASGIEPPPGIIANRNWFNENIIYIWFTIPGLMGILSMMITLMVTALSVAREKELGTFDQLLVSPLTPNEILLGKTIPAIIVGFFEGLFIFGASVVLFQLPFHGSFLLLLPTLLVFVTSIVGIGLFISAISKTQQQAILGVFTFMVPSVTLSGFAAPVENMPLWLQQATFINPLRHGITIFKGLTLKNLPATDVWHSLWPLLCIGIVTLVLSGWFFSRRLE